MSAHHLDDLKAYLKTFLLIRQMRIWIGEDRAIRSLDNSAFGIIVLSDDFFVV